MTNETLSSLRARNARMAAPARLLAPRRYRRDLGVLALATLAALALAACAPITYPLAQVRPPGTTCVETMTRAGASPSICGRGRQVARDRHGRIVGTLDR